MLEGLAGAGKKREEEIKGQQTIKVKDWVAMKAEMYRKGESRMKGQAGAFNEAVLYLAG